MILEVTYKKDDRQISIKRLPVTEFKPNDGCIGAHVISVAAQSLSQEKVLEMEIKCEKDIAELIIKK